MLLTGLLGQAGHDWAHAAVASQRAWSQAMDAEHAWLASTAPADPDADTGVRIFAAGKGHTHGDGADPLHGGPATEHAHAVVFLVPPGSALTIAGRTAITAWPNAAQPPAAPSDSPDRPPRSV
ncbi:MAG: hypothetical protein V4653_01495 [Pseudomonadota bacterium]